MFIRNKHEKLRFPSIFTDILEEAGEPWPKKTKIDRSNSNLDDQQQSLQRLYYATKESSNTTLCFSQILCNVNQKGLELQDGNTTNLITSVRPYELCVDVNFQSRMIRYIPFYEKCILENRECGLIGDACSELSEQKILVTDPESRALHAKGEEPIESGGSWSELATVNPVSNDTRAENLITRIAPLLKGAPEFQSNENGGRCHHVHDISRSKALYQVLKPVTVCDSSSLLARSFMKGSKSDLGSLFYTNVNEIGNILSFPKQTRSSANNNFRSNKEFQHLYKPYSRKCERIINPKLVKCAAFELLLQDKREYNCSTANEKNDNAVQSKTTMFSQRTAFNIQLKEISKESSSKECHIFSKATVESDNTVSIDNTEKEKKARHALYDNQILQHNNICSSSVWDTNLSTAEKEEDLTAHLRHLNTLSSVPNMFKKLRIKHSTLKTMATMVTCTQNKKIKNINENSVFSLRKCTSLHFVLRANQKRIVKRLRNGINFVRERKNGPRYQRTCSRAVMDKRKDSICGDVGGNHCSSVAAKTHMSFFETYKKIPLSDNCEELDQISFISKVIFKYKNTEKYSKGCTATASRITYNGDDVQAYFLPQLFSAITNCNCLLVQESKSKNSQYPNNIGTNSQVLKQNNSTAFPINGPNSRNILSFTSVVFRDLCIDQISTVSVKAWHSKVALFGNRRKQYSCIFDNMKSVLQDEPVHRSQVSNRLKQIKVKTVRSMKVLLQNGFFPSSAHGSELVVSVKQNVEYERERENATVEKIYTRKKHNLILPYFKNESAKIITSEDRLMEFSCGITQEHFEDVTEKHFSPEFKNKYEFEMNQFDLVLKELNGFNDTSKGNMNSLQCEQKTIIQEEFLELNCLDSILQDESKNICENKENVTFSTCGTSFSSTTVVNQNKNGQIIFKDPGLKCSGEQEVPHEDCSSRILEEELFYPTPEECFDSGCKQPLPWNPAFVSRTSMGERSYSLQGERGNFFKDGIIRVQPLKTCHGPLRVGLSRKAKPKQLHPYLK